MNVLDRKKCHLETLKERIEKHKREDAVFRHQISVLKRKERTKKLISAGRIFEEAGILNSYDHDEVLMVLSKLKNKF
ncbi:MAG: hypothetical protein H6Q70_63 [Firmicutes bacterium]|nr:hypothetical protein [Bacillota bacterium]